MTQQEIKNKKISESYAKTKIKRKEQQCHVFSIKIQKNKLNIKQREALKMLFTEAKWLYNAILSWSENYPIKDYDTKTNFIIHKDKDFNDVKSQFQFIGSQIKQSIQTQILTNIKALSRLKKNGHLVGKLHYESEHKQIELKQYNVTYTFKKNKVKLQNVPGWIKVNGLNQFINKDYEIANAKLLNTPKGYYLKITCYRDKNKEPKTTKKEQIGIDMGCQTAVTLSDGRKFHAQVKESDRLKRLQKKMLRQKKSNNYMKTKKLLRVEYQKMTDKKNDCANKILHVIKQYDEIYMQDELLQKWQKNGHGRAVQHSVLGRVKMKATLFATNVLSSFTPTTKFCHQCGALNDMPLIKRIYECSCGAYEDRDVHAAKNMIFLSTCGMQGIQARGACRAMNREAAPSLAAR